MKITDQRVRKTNEVLDGIKVIKLYGWEDSFVKVKIIFITLVIFENVKLVYSLNLVIYTYQ